MSGGHRKDDDDWPDFLDLRRAGAPAPMSEPAPLSAPAPSGAGQAGLPEAAQRLEPGDEAAFHTRLVAFLRRNKPAGEPLVAGNVQVLDLDDVRRHFAGRWESAKQKIHQLTDLTIRHHIGAEDLYFLVEVDEEYVIMFAKAGKAEAGAKARLIAAEVNAKLSAVGLEGAQVTVRGLAVEILQKSVPGLALSATAIRAAVAEAAAAEALAGPRRLIGKSGAAAVEYWPMANVRKRLVSIYDARLVGAVDRSEDGVSLFQTDIDCHFVSSAAEVLSAAQKPHHKACLLIPANFETLTAKGHRDAYVEACRALPRTARRRLILEVLQVPASVPQSRFLQVLAVVAPFFLGFAVRVPLGFHAPERYRGMRILALTIDGRHLAHPSTREFDQLMALADGARRHKLRIMFLNAASIEAATAARYAHCEYIDGEVVGPRVDDPGRS